MPPGRTAPAYQPYPPEMYGSGAQGDLPLQTVTIAPYGPAYPDQYPATPPPPPYYDSTQDTQSYQAQPAPLYGTGPVMANDPQVYQAPPTYLQQGGPTMTNDPQVYQAPPTSLQPAPNHPAILAYNNARTTFDPPYGPPLGQGLTTQLMTPLRAAGWSPATGYPPDIIVTPTPYDINPPPDPTRTMEGQAAIARRYGAFPPAPERTAADIYPSRYGAFPPTSAGLRDSSPGITELSPSPEPGALGSIEGLGGSVLGALFGVPGSAPPAPIASPTTSGASQYYGGAAGQSGVTPDNRAIASRGPDGSWNTRFIPDAPPISPTLDWLGGMLGRYDQPESPPSYRGASEFSTPGGAPYRGAAEFSDASRRRTKKGRR